MKIWLRGGSWEVQGGEGVKYFPIYSDKYDENGLIEHLHLTAEGYPTVWGPAHSFVVRLTHSLLRLEEEEEAYRRQCYQAATDLLTLIAAQFLGILRPDEVPMVRAEEDGSVVPLQSKLLRMLHDSLRAEERPIHNLVVLRDATRTQSPIAAINYPDCLWFPVHSFPLGTVAGRVERMLGRIEPSGLVIPDGSQREEVQPVVAQLRSYLQQLWQRAQDGSPLRRVLSRFDHGLQAVTLPSEVTIRSGRVFCWGGGRVDEVDLYRYSNVEEVGLEAGCPSCKRDWMNHRFEAGRLVLQGGANPQRNVTCPLHGQEIAGWRDLLERSVFYDETEASYVIWADDPTDEGAWSLQFPPDAERLEVQRGPDGQGFVRFRFNQAEIEVRGRVVRLREVLLRQVLAPPRGAHLEILPLNGEEVACVDWPQGGLLADPAHRGSWEVRLRGGWRPFKWQVESFSDPVLSEPGNATLLLWPGFEDPGWQAETVVYAVRERKSAVPVVRCYAAGDRSTRNLAELKGEGPSGSTAHFQRRIEALEFRSPGNEPWGYVRPQRARLLPGRFTDGTVALDFGTSNTVVGWKANGVDFESIGLDQDAPPLAVLAPATARELEAVAAENSLLPFWPRREGSRWCIPSELLIFPDRETWTIPHDAIDPSKFENVFRDFKWYDENNVLRRTYLAMVLRIALANLRAKGLQSVALRVTYPLAFERHHLAEYSEIVEALVVELRRDTGLTVALDGFCNESISGLEACSQKAGNLHCVVDFGGGTTDIAIRVPGREDPLFVDSVRMAGNDVLDSLLADPAVVDGILRFDKGRGPSSPRSRPAVARQIVLRDLRSSSGEAPRFWNRLAGAHSGAAERFAERNRAIFDGILGYVLRLLAEAEKSIPEEALAGGAKGAAAAIFLVGQGWGLLRLQKGRGEHDPRAYVNQRLDALRQALPGPRGRYRFDVILPDLRSPKEATSLGAAIMRKDQVRPVAGLLNTTGRNTILGVNVQFHDGQKLDANERLEADRGTITSAVARHDAWSNFVEPLLNAPGGASHVRELFGPSDIERQRFVDYRMNDLIDKHMGEQLARGNPLIHSPLRLLLEKVWAERLKQSGR